MRIVLFRHGPAGPRDASRWPDDRDRPLTEPGIGRTHAAARGLVRLEPRLDRVLTSPLMRCLQSARLLAEVAATHEDATPVNALAPGGSWRQALRVLAEREGDHAVALVGHQGELGRLAGVLLFGASAPALVTSDGLPLRKGGACCIVLEPPFTPGEGALRWLLPPRALRRLARRRSRV